ncbi:iron-containing alcohol dehydrogenase [Pseudoflavonifractor sp. MSJ-37]|uniref:iron-containing alcohol dehydrogenase n=1 Tax=Pseudoflavonifractor sp. MSJ-37 TaxID=2841531 RepID=UPI001C0FDE7E|nr:iron-containing alcohol dehydrogenase [Pseudoflavonifractor sp. MSJ-37]MBU5435399.1 iron-containing alcohol dehydrogenase [Pseudoflavonifractor sp. MSJ-37]
MVTKYHMPVDVRFGAGCLKELADFLSAGDRVLLVTDPGLEAVGLVDRVRDVISPTGAECRLYDKVEPNPTADMVEAAMVEIRDYKPTKVVALGGGSSMDVGKVVAALCTNEGPLVDYQWNGKPFANAPLPLIAIPTTAGTGSEVTMCAVIVDRNCKKGINGPAMFPKAALVDAELMASLPLYLTATTGMDALSHAIESYVGLGANPITDAMAREAIRLIGGSLWGACANGQDRKARQDMALGSVLAGVAMDQAGLGLVHTVSSPLCTFFHMAHGEANAVLLKYCMRYNLIARPERYADIAGLLGVDTAGMSTWQAAEASVAAVERLLDETGVKVPLLSFGMKESDAELVADNLPGFMLCNNPRTMNKKQCVQFYLDILADQK